MANQVLASWLMMVSYRHLQDFGCLLVGEAVHIYESDQDAMFRRELLEARVALRAALQADFP